MTDFDDWLDGRLPPDAPMHVRNAIRREQEGRLEEALTETGDPQIWTVMYVADNMDLVLDMLTLMAMDGVYGRNQEERIASLLMMRRYANGVGGRPEADYCTMEAVLSRFRTHVVPKEVCP